MLNVHPFPARMAPDLALETLQTLKHGSVVLDPMAGSGTVLQQAATLNLSARGFDLDPLAVLISKVATTPIADAGIADASEILVSEAKALRISTVKLSWMDGDDRTERFVEYWFGDAQRNDLRRLAYVLSRPGEFGIAESVADVLRVALSRIIVTKKAAASLAQDTSHSRPHRVQTTSDYDVFLGYEKSVRALRKRVAKIECRGTVQVGQGDARDLIGVGDSSVDFVLTSPPYLNAIDYMRGHKMSLVWLGFGIDELARRRSTSIGAERRPDKPFETETIDNVIRNMGDTSALSTKYQGMIRRYAIDLHEMLGEVARVLKHKARTTFVMGNSCLKGAYIENSEALIAAARSVGLKKVKQWERDLPSDSRYLPTPTTGALSKRMRKEVVVTLRKP